MTQEQLINVQKKDDNYHEYKYNCSYAKLHFDLNWTVEDSPGKMKSMISLVLVLALSRGDGK